MREILTYFLNVKYKNSVAMWDHFWDTEELPSAKGKVGKASMSKAQGLELWLWENHTWCCFFPQKRAVLQKSKPWVIDCKQWGLHYHPKEACKLMVLLQFEQMLSGYIVRIGNRNYNEKKKKVKIMCIAKLINACTCLLPCIMRKWNILMEKKNST